ncbi:MAG: hypothetical protein EB104_06770 [Acidimicrobiia bacterium]|nr:hypothetical protein [Acidimicrobiia bacterium]
MAFPNRRTTDAGMVTGLLVGMFTSIIALSALVFDGARLVAARAELEDHAANAGRAAAQEIISAGCMPIDQAPPTTIASVTSATQRRTKRCSIMNRSPTPFVQRPRVAG